MGETIVQFAYVFGLHSGQSTQWNSLRPRLEQHRAGKGSEFVKQYGIYRLVYVENYGRPDEAIAREKQLKRWKRDWKIRLIEQDNLDWSDLSHLV